jgi:hypothetical protein
MAKRDTMSSSIRPILLTVGLCLAPLAGIAQGAITFNVQQPAANAIVGNQLVVQVAVTSTYELTTVNASVETQSAALAYSSVASAWTNTLSLSNLSRGLKTLTITATDAFGNSAQTQTTVRKDLPPTLTVLQPLVGTVARPSFQISASATDDDPVGTVINVYAGTNLLVTGTNTINTQASLPDDDGQAVDLRFDAVDSVGHTNSVTRTLYILANTNWVESAQVAGPILDVSTNTILFVDGNILKTKSRLTGAETVLLDDTNITPSVGALTPFGALIGTAGAGSVAPTAYEVKNGLVTNLGPGISIAVHGNYAVWLTAPGWRTLVYRDLVASTNTAVSTVAWGATFAPNGDVIYGSETERELYNLIVRYRNGTNAVLVNGGYYFGYDFVQTDGTNLVYHKYSYLDSFGGRLEYQVLFDGAAETTLSTNIIGVGDPYGYPAISQGWVAYRAAGSGGTSQLWTRSPTGVQAQQTFFTTWSRIQGLAPNGQFLFFNGGRLYQARAGTIPLDLGAWNFGGPWDIPGAATVFWQQGQWYTVIGRSLFVLAPPLVFTSASQTGNGQFHLVVGGNLGDTVVTQFSTNLVDWSNIATNTVTNGVFEVLDTVNPGTRRAFYRAVVQGH